ncbi:hypothetical protein [Stenotrophomonas rhizophila]|uniref:hypothetical protein n=1 Tax=Stenotrophomonas rhizophila TaxID=216778 RepID=UPI001AEC6733|nr:hypothetical protein [Stenotrophomonas rhizophila]
MTEAAAPLTVAATVRAMRRAGAAGMPVPAAQVESWARNFMIHLYGPQKPVRLECRPRHTVEPWIQAEDADVVHALRRGLEVRALYLHPKVEKPTKAHRFRDGNCRDCGDGEFYAGPNCEPPTPPPDSRAALPFDPTWFRAPLEALIHIATHRFIGVADSMKWKSEARYLLERLDHYDKETK